MSTLHLATGSALPPKVEGKLRLYSMLFCPYAQRSRLVLIAKQLPHDIVNVDLKKKPEWLFELNPAGKVPVLDTGSLILPESLDVSDYLDKEYPDPPLYPSDPKLVQQDKELIKSFDKLTALNYAVVSNTENKTLAQHGEVVRPALDKLEAELEKRGLFFGGKSPKMVDYMLWPWAERIPVIPLFYKEKLPFTENDFPRLLAWYKAMRTQKAVQETEISAERFFKFLSAYKSGGPVDYDGF